MNTLYLDPGKNRLFFAFHSSLHGTLFSGHIDDFRHIASMHDVAREVRQRGAAGAAETGHDLSPGIIALRVPTGGTALRGHTIADESTGSALKKITAIAPFHIPCIIALADVCLSVFGSVPVVFIVESAFFNTLPVREKLYAIDPKSSATPVRHGYHGMFHEAAARLAVNMGRAGKRSAAIVSICLQPRPELAAIRGSRPLMVSSGATPLEGLLGDTSCGDMDAGILTTLANGLQWGPERINQALTGESGILGLTGNPATLLDLFTDEGPGHAEAREIFLYKLLQLCGSAVAALGTIDTIIFSGKYREAGKKIGPWLENKLVLLDETQGKKKITWAILPREPEEIAAEIAAGLIGASKTA